MTTLFVYGSLKRGEGNHRVLAQSTFVGVARTAPHFSLYDFGPYPAMTAIGDTAVEGELYDVDDETLAAVDRLEGHPFLYERIALPIVGRQGVEGYVYRGGYGGESLRSAERLVDGRWTQRRA